MTPEQFSDSLRPEVVKILMAAVPEAVEHIMNVARSSYEAGQVDGRTEANSKACEQIRNITKSI